MKRWWKEAPFWQKIALEFVALDLWFVLCGLQAKYNLFTLRQIAGFLLFVFIAGQVAGIVWAWHQTKVWEARDREWEAKWAGKSYKP
jgi:hypothetical protein